MKIENVFVRALTIGLIGAVLLMAVGLIIHIIFSLLWKLAAGYCVLMIVVIIIKHYLRKFSS